MVQSINEYTNKIKIFFRDSGNREKFLTVAIICLVGTASFGLGRLSVFDGKKEPVKIENLPMEARILGSNEGAEGVSISEGNLNSKSSSEVGDLNEETYLKQGGAVVASKNGSKYHFPWCSGAKRTLEENKIYFSSIEEARAAGYTPAANCKGLE